MKYADLYRVTLAPYVHSNFSVTLGQRFLEQTGYGNYDKDELSVANGWLETYVRQFLDAYLKGSAAGHAFLNLPAARTGAPAHLLTVHKTNAQAVPATRASFAAELARTGFEQASAIYRDRRKRDPGFALLNGELNAWGYKLLADGEVHSSIAILRLNAELHADSWNAFDSLGEAYATHGNKALATEAYRKSLALNPGNMNAVARLSRFGVKP